MQDHLGWQDSPGLPGLQSQDRWRGSIWHLDSNVTLLGDVQGVNNKERAALGDAFEAGLPNTVRT